MSRGEKTPESMDKVADTFTQNADKEWAKAKNGEGGYHYEYARTYYATADMARRAAESMRNEE